MSGCGLWQIEHRGELRLALRRATSLRPQGNKRDYISYKTLYDGVLLVLYVAALVASGS